MHLRIEDWAWRLENLLARVNRMATSLQNTCSVFILIQLWQTQNLVRRLLQFLLLRTMVEVEEKSIEWRLRIIRVPRRQLGLVHSHLNPGALPVVVPVPQSQAFCALLL